MSSIAQSRSNWKKKAIVRGHQNRIQQRALLARDRKIESIETKLYESLQANADLNAKLEKVQRLKNPPARIDTVIICIQLFIFARISFRSIPRVLRSIGWLGWIPSIPSPINWICRLGLHKIREAAKQQGSWIAIIDMTVDISYKKALVVLRIPLKVFAERKTALTLNDVHCVGLSIKKEWNGETVAQALLDIIGDGKDLKAIIKDNGPDLSKGVEIWGEQHSSSHVSIISDLGHEVANALKADFDDKIKFTEVTASIKSGATKLFQSRLAFLAPPKIRTKGRYMSISRLAKWFDKIREVLGGPGRAAKGSLIEQVRDLFGGLGHIHYVLDQLSERSIKLAEVMEILKNKGINQKTYREAMAIVESLPPRSQSRVRIRRWLRTHLALQARLSIGQTPLPISSDILESVFGSFKNFIARNPKAELNQLVLGIPALCGPTTTADIYASQQTVSHKEMREWVSKNIGTTSMSRRRNFFQGKIGEDWLPVPGDPLSA